MRPLLPQDDLDTILSLTPLFWSQFKGARIFMTGGTGFIGMWLLETIQHANNQLGSRIEVAVLSRRPEHAKITAPHLFKSSSITLIEGDVSRFCPPVGKFDLCIHAATDVGDVNKSKNVRTVFESMTSGTRRVLDLAESNGACRFLFTSSGAIYGVQPPTMERIPESFTGAPNSLDVSAAYGNGKRAAEWLCCEASKRAGFNASIARLFALLGPGLPLNGPFAAGNFVRDILDEKPLHIQGDGRTVRSYLYMLDVCVWLLEILRTGAQGQAYNVGSEEAISVADLAQRMIDVSGTSLTINRAESEFVKRNTAPPRYVPDTSKAREEFSLAQYTPLNGALQKTIQWSRAAMKV